MFSTMCLISLLIPFLNTFHFTAYVSGGYAVQLRSVENGLKGVGNALLAHLGSSRCINCNEGFKIKLRFREISEFYGALFCTWAQKYRRKFKSLCLLAAAGQVRSTRQRPLCNHKKRFSLIGVAKRP